MGIDDWSTDESQNLELDGSDISRRASPGAPANELTRKLMAHVKELEEKIVSDGIAVDGITIENNSGTLTVKDVAIDGDTTDLLTAKIEEIEAAATQAGEDATAAQTAATQAAASAASVETAVTAAATAANVAAEQADIAARAAARAQSGAALAESAVQAVISGTNLNWQKSDKVGAVAVYPVPETALEPVVEFLFSETGPESGDKSPDNPSTITGVSGVAVTRCGANLIPYPYKTATSTVSGVAFTVNSDGSVLVNGTASARIIFDLAVGVPIKKDATYVISGCPDGGASNSYGLGVDFKTIENNSYVAHIDSFGTQDNGTYTASTNLQARIFIHIPSGKSVANLVFRPQLGLGSVASAFELHEGADYAMLLGSTYYGGRINFADGEMAVTHVAVTPETSTIDISSDPAKLPLEYTDTYGRTITSAEGTSLVVGGTGGTVVYALATPYTIQLSPVQIYALAQADKYTPRLNIVYSDQQTVLVGYVKSPMHTE